MVIFFNLGLWSVGSYWNSEPSQPWTCTVKPWNVGGGREIYRRGDGSRLSVSRKGVNPKVTDLIVNSSLYQLRQLVVIDVSLLSNCFSIFCLLLIYLVLILSLPWRMHENVIFSLLLCAFLLKIGSLPKEDS